MATGLQNEEKVPENLKKQLALAVRSIQWSYAIFWSISARQPGVLEWGEGYYNGDIKTRKTVQAVELNADQIGLQRSEQLRALYESLSAGEANPQAKRPSAALSPEDLSDTEWYYLVCMSFVFNTGQGLPGRTLADGQPIWLCNAPFADSKVFSRSLLAKTVACFPFLGGVIELGVTDLVVEDYALIDQVKMSLLEIPYTKSSKKSDLGADKGFAGVPTPVVGGEEINMSSPSPSSNGLEPNQPTEDSFMVEGKNGAASQVQSWQVMDDEVSNCVPQSMDSSDCISQTLVEPEKVALSSKRETAQDHRVKDLKECNQTKISSLDLRSEDIHYKGVISTLFKSSHQLILGPNFQNLHQGSSFISWKKGRVAKKPRGGASQKLVKKVLFEVPRMHVKRMVDSAEDNGNKNGAWRPEADEKLVKKVLFEVPRMHVKRMVDSAEDNGNKNGAWRPEADEVGVNHALSERRRRERLNEKFSILKTMIPSLTKDDKVSILDDAIEYLKELERRIEELESCRELEDLEPKTRRKPQDAREGTSDNYGNKKNDKAKKPSVNKRKACDMEEVGPYTNHTVSKDSSADSIAVSMKNKVVIIEIRCPWREGLLLEIIDALSNLHLDSHSVQSSTVDGIISLIIQSTV
ncbi:hypothetical protein L484_024273 [Morus notabilis]|uniref:BHLH domain-containing protein n=1 Tax=Morus notabilis TaxID=981085 RepID=W9QPL7_9ROSA|nr:hypothetical protein L484_024273 [Morus notabilis]